MRKATLLAALGLAGVVGLSPSVAAAGPTQTLHINEIQANPETPDATGEYVELKGTAGAVVAANTYLVFVESDVGTAAGTSQGDVQQVFNLSGLTLGSNGFLVLLQGASQFSGVVKPGATVVTGAGTGFNGVAGFQSDATTGEIENESWTAFLITSTTPPTLTTDIDPPNNGTATLPAEWTVLDAVSALDPLADPGYAEAKFFDGEWVGRPTGDPSGLDKASWVGAGFANNETAYPFHISAADPAAYEGATLDHIGGPNFPAAGPPPVIPEVPMPALLPLAAAGIALGATAVSRRRRTA